MMTLDEALAARAVPIDEAEAADLAWQPWIVSSGVLFLLSGKRRVALAGYVRPEKQPSLERGMLGIIP